MDTFLTSQGHPIRVDWLPDLGLPGRLGLTFAPGKHGRSLYSAGVWQRDLDLDLKRLVEVWEVTVLVCLLEDAEFLRLKIPDYLEKTAAGGLRVLRLPIVDGSIPSDLAAVVRLVSQILEAMKAGANVVIHCAGGLGRAGTIAGCCMVRRGIGPDETLAALRACRSEHCPENEAQRNFIRRFAAEQTARGPAATDLSGMLASAPTGKRLARHEVQSLLRSVEGAVAADPVGSFDFDAQGFAKLRVKDQVWAAGRFETPSIGELRRRVTGRAGHGPVRLSVLRGTSPRADVAALQARCGPGTMFQVASQFNALEAPGPRLVPVSAYVSDPTQGPRASVSAFPGTFLRHYRAPGDGGRRVQRSGACLNLLDEALSPDNAEVRDGYLSSPSIRDARKLVQQLEDRFESIKIGLHEGVEVALGGDWGGPVSRPAPRIAQVFTSTMALGGYSSRDAGLRAACRPLLRAAYLGTLLAANGLGQSTVVLTMIGGGVFGNPVEEIFGAIRWALAEADGSAPQGLHVVLNLWSGGLDTATQEEVRRRGGAVIDL